MYYEERLYSTGNYYLDDVLERAFSEGYSCAIDDMEERLFMLPSSSHRMMAKLNEGSPMKTTPHPHMMKTAPHSPSKAEVLAHKPAPDVIRPLSAKKANFAAMHRGRLDAPIATANHKPAPTAPSRPQYRYGTDSASSHGRVGGEYKFGRRS